MTDLRDAESKGLISHAPHYNSLFRCLESETVTPIIHDLIIRAAIPLRAVETDFAIDSTGSLARNWSDSGSRKSTALKRSVASTIG